MAFIFGYSNLVVANNSGAPTQQVDMTADWIVVDDGSGNTLRIPMTTNINIDKNQSQKSTEAFKRDGAGVANPTAWYSNWINIWAIYNPVTNTIAGLFSLSATAPTLPSGYTHKALVGAAYNNSSGNFNTFSQVDNKVAAYTEYAGMAISGGMQPAWTPVDLALLVPGTAKIVRGSLDCNTGTTGKELGMFVASTSGGLDAVICYTKLTTGSPNYATAPFTLPIMSPQTLWYKIVRDTNGNGNIYISGWEY